MLTLFKSLFTKRPAEFDRAPVSTPPAPAAPAQPAPRPPVTPTESFAPPPALPSGVRALSIPLRSIIDKLPDQVKGTVQTVPPKSVLFMLPVQTALEQLPGGAVKVPFGQIRAAAPPETFAPAHDQDDLMVSLPLQHILSQLDPSLLEKKSEKKYVQPSEQLRPIFGPNGQVSAMEDIVREHAPSTPPQQSPALPLKEAASIPTPIRPATKLTPDPQMRRSPAPPAAAHIPPAAPSIAPAAPKVTPRAGLETSTQLHVAPPTPPKLATPVSTPAPAALPAASLRMAAVQKLESETPGVLTFKLRDVCAPWPGALKTALALQMNHLTVRVPVQDLEPAIRSGKPAFPWRRVRSWISPAVPNELGEELDDTPVLFPLSAVIPAFMAQQQGGARRKVEVCENIPDVFASRNAAPAPFPTVLPPPEPEMPSSLQAGPFPAPESAEASSQAMEAVEETDTSAPEPELIPAPPLIERTSGPTSPAKAGAGATCLADLFGQPGRKEWTPAEIVEHTVLLPGLEGVLIGTDYGLPVASHWPSELNVLAMAGFLPGIFLKTGQFTKELRLGEPDAMKLQLGKRQLSLQRAGSWFFAAITHEGEPLPESQLAIVAKHVSENFS
jgi:predicted regulator of Ras-like GTPase activity (Roadblock/LC7/MglB family)